MPSHDEHWTIERYPEYDKEGRLLGVSFGCPDLGLMNFVSIRELLEEVGQHILINAVEDIGEITII